MFIAKSCVRIKALSLVILRVSWERKSSVELFMALLLTRKQIKRRSALVCPVTQRFSLSQKPALDRTFVAWQNPASPCENDLAEIKSHKNHSNHKLQIIKFLPSNILICHTITKTWLRNDAHGRIHKSFIETEIAFCFWIVFHLFLQRRSNYCAFYSDSSSNCFTLPHSFRMGLFGFAIQKAFLSSSFCFQESKIHLDGEKKNFSQNN